MRKRPLTCATCQPVTNLTPRQVLSGVLAGAAMDSWRLFCRAGAVLCGAVGVLVFLRWRWRRRRVASHLRVKDDWPRAASGSGSAVVAGVAGDVPPQPGGHERPAC